MKIKAKILPEDASGDMVLLRDMSDSAFGLVHIDMFWEERGISGDIFESLRDGEEVELEMVPTNES